MPETEDGHWWGGTIRVFPSYSDLDYSRRVELSLEPAGPLLDGSVGQPVVRTVDPAVTLFALDIPPGAYRVRAVGISADGTRTPLLVTQTGGTPVEVADFAFEPVEFFPTCASGSSSTGIARGFLDVVLP